MKRTAMLKILNPALAVLLGIQVTTGLFGALASGELHEACGIALAACAVLHLILNWGWVKMNLLPRGKAPGA